MTVVGCPAKEHVQKSGIVFLCVCVLRCLVAEENCSVSSLETSSDVSQMTLQKSSNLSPFVVFLLRLPWLSPCMFSFSNCVWPPFLIPSVYHLVCCLNLVTFVGQCFLGSMLRLVYLRKTIGHAAARKH